jgi:ribonucleoside-diphosphate reductase alpha chain
MVETRPERDALLTDFGKTTLSERYLLPGETFQGMFARVSEAFADDPAHAQRMYDYMSQLWFMPATPVLSNGGAGRALPISCFLNAVPDSMVGITATFAENMALSSNGGGLGTHWGFVRSIGEKAGFDGVTSGIIPFIRGQDALTLAVNQGSLRRGSAAVYLDIHHPEIEEFLEIRKTGGDMNRKSPNIHHGINVTDAFMHAVKAGAEFNLVSPKNGEVKKTVDARALWAKILDIRLQTGEPYLNFIDTANRSMSKFQRELGLRVSQSNLCSEIMLHTGVDHLGNDRTAVCCLSSLNAETFLEWRDHPTFIEDVMRFLDNVLQNFIDIAPATLSKATYSAIRERAVGLGLMGWHSFLQAQNLPFAGPMAKVWNRKIFRHIREQADIASFHLAQEKGPCPDAAERGYMERFSHKMAVAPTASISIICGGTSAGIEPIPANVYTHKTLSGSFIVKNRYLEELLATKGQNTDETWDSILANEGSIQQLSCLSEDEKDVYKTAFEIDQRVLVDQAADRAPHICQGQSLNIFLPGDVEKWDLHMLHWTAWERGVKSLYYLRSKSVQRAAHAGAALDVPSAANDVEPVSTNYEECVACQ